MESLASKIYQIYGLLEQYLFLLGGIAMFFVLFFFVIRMFRQTKPIQPVTSISDRSPRAIEVRRKRGQLISYDVLETQPKSITLSEMEAYNPGPVEKGAGESKAQTAVQPEDTMFTPLERYESGSPAGITRCPHCGREIPEGARSCGACGRDLV